ncbi:type III-A CRISPR-associated protein Csm2 [Schnuerera ultunensis]|uniref:type III-A CRISPR-associated protein Csm2 n=1 Tax=Schnuerera ultunensis TaxID=45497 RepID=UPI00041E5E8E|nr:type III-A CRISPR-associated protein Csm2 [Schnuerera ultunensis]
MIRQRQRGRSNYGGQNPINNLISEIKKAQSLKEVFIPEKYALPDGWAYKTAENLNEKAMNSNQLRKIFTQLKTIEESVNRNKENKLTNEQMNQILLIMPQIAYARGRDLIPSTFYNLMKECITPNKIKDKEDYKSFVGFYTAVVAYSKMGS